MINKQKILMLVSVLLFLVLIVYFYLYRLQWDHFLLIFAFPIILIISIKLDKIKHSHRYYYIVYFVFFLLFSIFNKHVLANLLILLSFYLIGRAIKIPLLSIIIILLVNVYIFTDYSHYTFDLGCFICLLGLLFKFENTGIDIIDINKSGPFI